MDSQAIESNLSNQAQRVDSGDVLKIFVRCEQIKFMPEAELGQQRVDSASLNTLLAATVPDSGCMDVIYPVRDNKGQRSKPIYDLARRLCSQKPL